MKRLTLTEKMAAAALALLLIAAGIAWWKTAPPALQDRRPNAAITSADLVDQRTYTTAERLAQLAVAPGEQSFSQSAVRIADHELDLAFTEALRDAEAHPPADKKDRIQDQLELAQSQLELDKDELDESNQNLVEAGGNPRQQIESMVQEHNSQTNYQQAVDLLSAKPASPE